jgi:hypothetical protein
MALVSNSTDGMFDMELTADQLNWLGSGRITIYDVSQVLVWWMDFEVVSQQYWDFMFGSTAPSVALTTASREAVADTLLDRSIGGGGNSGKRVKEALYLLRNKTTLSGGTLTVFAADGTTESWTASVTTQEGALPITGVSP